ncbi:MAG: PEP-CTERM sorting domain-containing protein [Phycisphaerae bacterium]
MNGNVASIVVDNTSSTETVIQIAKQFDDGPEFGQFPPIEIAFTQTGDDLSTVPSIVINDENIINNTGFGWTDYHWALIDGGQAWFNVSQSSTFDTSPFGTQSFADQYGYGDANKMTDLNVEGGFVPNGGTFTPGLLGGALWIDTDLSGANPVTFNFKQFPTNPSIPEPASLMLMLGGCAIVAGRRRK